MIHSAIAWFVRNYRIGIGAARVPDRSPPTPPGMRVRTGRFEQLRS
uniref:Transposase n=1 Tax=Aromatoleum anaerobium TaxID=182180 RepID=A0ABX1PH80_9RHOO